MLRPSEDAYVITLWGNITDSSRLTLINYVEQALQHGIKRLVIDFQNVDFIDCSGVCVLVEAVVLASRNKVDLIANNTSENMLAILKLTGIDQNFPALDLQTSPGETVTKNMFEGHNWSSIPVPLQIEGNVPADFINLNVNGRRLSGPLQGFGQLWQKTYTIEIDDDHIAPAEFVAYWKENFGQFWPQGNTIFFPGNKISLGQAGLLNLSMGLGLKLVTGMVVMYEDENSFAFLTPQGHMYAGWISFSANQHENSIRVQIQALIRASDPVYELGFRLGFGHKIEDRFWQKTLEKLAAQFGSKNAVQQNNRLIDPRIQWKLAKNLWYNAAIRTTFYLLLTPLRWLTGLLPNLHERKSQ